MSFTHQPTVCIDFDGTIVEYDSKWSGRGQFGKILPGAAKHINTLRANGWYIIIFTTRGEEKEIAKFLKKEGVVFDEINHNKHQPKGTNAGKPIADVYVDDRAITFKGDWSQTFKDIAKFKPWGEK